MLNLKKSVKATRQFVDINSQDERTLQALNAIKDTIHELYEDDTDLRSLNLTKDELAELWELGSEMSIVGDSIQRRVDTLLY